MIRASKVHYSLVIIYVFLGRGTCSIITANGHQGHLIQLANIMFNELCKCTPLLIAPHCDMYIQSHTVYRLNCTFFFLCAVHIRRALQCVR